MKMRACLSLFMCCIGQILAQDYCSLTVRVLSPDGRRLAVPVSVHEKNGRVEELRQESDDLRFCGLGGLPVTVTVGDQVCNQVVVKEVPMWWNEPYTLTVTYDPYPCMRDLPPPPVPICRVVFRIADSTGKWIRGATINVSHPLPTRLNTDSFGRASFVAGLGNDVLGSIPTGDRPINFKFTCTRSEPVHEEYIKIEKR